MSAGLCALGSALTLAACGGSSSGSGGISKTAMAGKANAACAGYTTAVRKLTVPKDFLSNPQSAARYLDTVKPLIQAQYQTLTSFNPADAGVRTTYASFKTAAAHQLSLFNDADAKAHARDASGIKDLQQLGAYKTATIVPIDLKLGWTTCASG
jgi:hypothetical protein